MRTRHTPAPWHYETDVRGNVVIWATRNGDDDKHIIGMAQFGPLEQREADARHICSVVNERAKTVSTADSDISGPAPKKCWFCSHEADGLHSHCGDYVPVCAAHSAELDREQGLAS